MTADDQGALSLGGKNAVETKNEIAAARTALARQTAALVAQEAELKATIDEKRRAPELIWADRAALTRVDGWVQRCRAAEAAERDREARENERVDRYVRPILAEIAAAVEAEAKARFNEDFDNAEDLWPAHLRSLKLDTTPIHRREIGALVRASLAGGHTIAGTSLGQLAALTGVDGFGRFASLRIDEPEEAREEASS